MVLEKFSKQKEKKTIIKDTLESIETSLKGYQSNKTLLEWAEKSEKSA